MAQAVKDIIIYLVFGSFALIGSNYIYTSQVSDKTAQNRQDIAVMRSEIGHVYKFVGKVEKVLDKLK